MSAQTNMQAQQLQGGVHYHRLHIEYVNPSPGTQRWPQSEQICPKSWVNLVIQLREGRGSSVVLETHYSHKALETS